jgi:hypothetical protein
MKRMLPFISILMSFSSSFSQQLPVYAPYENEIIAYIKKDLITHHNILYDTVTFMKANVLIKFDLSSVSSDVISKDYLKGFSFENSDMVKQNKKLIERVEDSLNKESNALNNLFPLKEQPKLDLSRDGGVYIFFSRKVYSEIYVEAVSGPPALLLTGDSFDIYGPGYNYLFKMNGNKIERVYKGEVAYN